MQREFQKKPHKLELHLQVRLHSYCLRIAHLISSPTLSFSGSSTDAGPSSSQRRLNLDPDAPSEEGEAMDETNVEEEAMMAAMGLAGFGTTKVCWSSNLL